MNEEFFESGVWDKALPWYSPLGRERERRQKEYRDVMCKAFSIWRLLE